MSKKIIKKKFLLKKSQITIFIILGLVVLIIFGLLMYYRSNVIGSKAETETEKAAKQQLDVAPIKYYIEKTIRDTFLEGYKLYGLQGGNLNTNENINNFRNKIGTGYFPEHEKIAFGIINNDRGTGDPYLDGGSSPENYQYGWLEFLTTLGLDPVSNQFKSQMEAYMSNKLDKDFENVLNLGNTEFETKLGYTIEEINPPGRPTVNIKVNDQDISMDVNYPLLIKKGDLEMRLDNFKILIKHNIYELNSFISHLIQKTNSDGDIFNLTFDIDNINLDTSRFTVTRIEAKDSSGNDITALGLRKYDVINITDNSFFIDGMPYTFLFLRENRAPDANTINITRMAGGNEITLQVGNSIISGQEELIIYCPNYINKDDPNYIMDPDEDDKNTLPTYILELFGERAIKQNEGLDNEGCSGIEDIYPYPFTSNNREIIHLNDCRSDGSELLPTSACYVGFDFIINITDDGGLSDTINFTKPVRCNIGGSNIHCSVDRDNMWDVGQPCGTTRICLHCKSRKIMARGTTVPTCPDPSACPPTDYCEDRGQTESYCGRTIEYQNRIDHCGICRTTNEELVGTENPELRLPEIEVPDDTCS